MKYKHEQPLSEGLKQHFESVTLSTARLEQLNKLNTKGNEHGQTLKQWAASVRRLLRNRYVKPVIPVVGVMLLVAALLPFVEKAQLPGKVSDEIAYNHSKGMALEVRSSTLSDVAAYLSQLDFSLITSNLLNPNQWELLGGRYCSIQGKIAAQLRVRSREDGRVFTMYQALMPDNMRLESPHNAVVNGVEITLWQEGELLIGLAGTIV